MASTANESCFAQPHWRVIAQGFKTEHWFGDGQAVGTGGILNPRPVHLPRLYAVSCGKRQPYLTAAAALNG